MISEFNKFMKDTNNLDKPSTMPELNRILTSMSELQLLFALSYIYSVVNLDDRYLLKDMLSKHKQRLTNATSTEPITEIQGSI